MAKDQELRLFAYKHYCTQSPKPPYMHVPAIFCMSHISYINIYIGHKIRSEVSKNINKNENNNWTQNSNVTVGW